MPIARHYQSDRNPDEAGFSGVPLGDIDDETWSRMPAWLQASVDAWTVDGRKVYLMSHRAAPEEASEQDTKPAPKSKKAATPPDEPVVVLDEPEPEPPPPDETPVDVPSEEGAT